MAGGSEVVVTWRGGTTETVNGVPAWDGANVESPEYLAMTMSVPRGALEETQEPEPPDNVAVHILEVPMLKLTVPVGCPDPEVGATVAE